MTEYYINPLIFYGIEVLRNINSLCLAGFIVGIVICGLMGIGYLSGYDNEWIIPILKRAVIGTLILAVPCVVIPSEKVMYRMLIASYFTKENTQQALDTIDMATEKLINKIIRARENKK